MNTPLVVVDTNTGFCITSNNLRSCGAQTKNKSALAVLCNSVLLQWESCGDEDKCYTDGVESLKVVAASLLDDSCEVLFFSRKESLLCVVFANCDSVLFGKLSLSVVVELCSRKGGLGKVKLDLRQHVGSVLTNTFECKAVVCGISEYGIYAKGPGSKLEFSAGCLEGGLGALAVFVERMSCSQASCMNGCTVLSRYCGDVRIGAVFKGGCLSSCINLLDSEVVMQWIISLCEG